MKAFLIAMILFVTAAAQANYDRLPQNIKLPTQFISEHIKVGAPASASATTVLNAHTAVVGGETVTTFAAQPDMPRNLTVTPGGTTANVVSGNVVISGTDIRGHAISETFAIVDTQSTATVGAKAFGKVTSIVFPAAGASTTWSVGESTKIGINKCLDEAAYLTLLAVDGAVATGVTVAIDAANISGNTFIPNPAPNGARVFDIVFYQNFRCD